MARITTLLVLGILGLAPTSGPAKAQGLSSAQQDLWDMEVAYWEAIATRDIDRYMELWHPDAMAWPGTSRPAVTVEQLREQMVTLFQGATDGFLQYELGMEAVRVHGKTGLTFCSVQGTIRSTGGRVQPLADRFVHTWIKHKGGWVIIGGMGANLAAEMGDDPREVLAQAQELAGQGRYAEALDRHIWFHDHALENQPALAGVRLSFALSYWMKLGEQYPPALEALGNIRNSKTRLIEEGNGTHELFSDVVAINRVFEEPQRSYELFKLVHERYPHLAQYCYFVVKELLVEHREYEICLTYESDYRIAMDQLREMRELNQQHARRDAGTEDPRMLALADRSYLTGVALLLEIFAGVGRDDDVEEIERLALEVLDNYDMHDAIAAALARAKETP